MGRFFEFLVNAISRSVSATMIGRSIRRVLSPGSDQTPSSVVMDALVGVMTERTSSYFGQQIFEAVTQGEAEEYLLAQSEIPNLGKMWVGEMDGCLHCTAYSGEYVGVDAEFPEGLTYDSHPIAPSAHDDLDEPPLHPNCVVPSTRIAARGISAVTGRHYGGEVVTIQTRSGKELTATPNHPILTPHGWVGAGELDVGDDLISHLGEEWPLGGLKHNQKMTSRIQDVARAFDKASTVATVEVPVSPEDFHGDGLGSEVAVVRADRLLWDGVDAAFSKKRRQFTLSVGVVPSLQLPGLGGEAQLLEALGPTSGSFVGGSGESSAALSAFAGHADGVGFTAPSGLDTGLSEPTPEGGSLDAELSGKGKFALTRDVAVDPIVVVRRWDYSGHVMNLETRDGWYLAEGIVTHNCRCELTPVDGDSAEEMSQALKREGERSILRGWSLDSESERSRVEAAERLLASNPDMPKSVQNIAEGAVRRGEFTTRTPP